MEADQTIWDTSVIGFGARRQRSEAITYFLMYRGPDGKQRRHTIGRHGPFTPDKARERAKTLQGKVAEGTDPAIEKSRDKAAASIAELCDRYLQDARAGRLLTKRRVGKKPSTLDTDEGRIERHIKPLLGEKKIASVSRDDVENFMHDVATGKTATRQPSGKLRGISLVRGGKGTASRTVGLLGAIFTYAVKKGMRPDNPVRGVVRFADQKRERRLADGEYPLLEKAFKTCEAENMWPPAILAAKFLLMTGWRRGEVLGLKWSDLDLERRTAILSDTKTGRSVRPLSQAACEIIKAAIQTTEFVFTAARGDGAMNGLPRFWTKILAAGQLSSDITPHVLRHSFASLASDLGLSEPTIATLIGHKGHSVTSRYVHSADAVLLAAADDIARKIKTLMSQQGRPNEQ